MTLVLLDPKLTRAPKPHPHNYLHLSKNYRSDFGSERGTLVKHNSGLNTAHCPILGCGSPADQRPRLHSVSEKEVAKTDPRHTIGLSVRREGKYKAMRELSGAVSSIFGVVLVQQNWNPDISPTPPYLTTSEFGTKRTAELIGVESKMIGEVPGFCQPGREKTRPD
ncbi:hypothetical protein C8R44DRAFT_735988 [Mycena epipterygia]|nr:hypothetical protein C8R44DRAFT_735988 [Mycena epipterygia]